MDEMVLATALSAYLKEAQKIEMKEIAQFAWKKISQCVGVNSTSVWTWVPDNSKVTTALMRVALEVFKQTQEKNVQECREELIVTLARYAHFRSADPSDQDIVRDIKNLPAGIDLGGFPLKEEFRSCIAHVNTTDNCQGTSSNHHSTPSVSYFPSRS